MRFIPAVSLVQVQLPLPLSRSPFVADQKRDIMRNYVSPRPVGQAVKTPAFHAGNTSSSLVRVTIVSLYATIKSRKTSLKRMLCILFLVHLLYSVICLTMIPGSLLIIQEDFDGKQT